MKSTSESLSHPETTYPKPNKYVEFLYFRLLDAKQTLGNLGPNSATKGNVNKSKFEGMEIVSPPSDLINRYHAFVSPIFAEILSLTCRNQNLRQTRDPFQRNLFSVFPECANPTLAKASFSLDHYPVDAGFSPAFTVESTRYGSQLFSHNRLGVWKGMLKIDLNTPADDTATRTELSNTAP
jgi:hypothetical protein